MSASEGSESLEKVARCVPSEGLYGKKRALNIVPGTDSKEARMRCQGEGSGRSGNISESVEKCDPESGFRVGPAAVSFMMCVTKSAFAVRALDRGNGGELGPRVLADLGVSPSPIKGA